jgi:hypothetical protein
MNILRWPRKVVTSFFWGIAAAMDSPGTPHSKMGLTETEKLDKARFALGRIVRLSENNPSLNHYFGRAITKIAKEAYEDAQK